MAFTTLLTLDGTVLTNHNRKFSEKREDRFVEVQLANGRTRRYLKYTARTWDISWTWLPNDTSTPDTAPGRDGIKALAFAPGEKTLIVYEVGGSSNSYTVFLDDYSEDLLRRNPAATTSYWDVTVSLKEV